MQAKEATVAGSVDATDGVSKLVEDNDGAPQSNTPTNDNHDILIPPDIIQKWQRIVDLLAHIVHVPSAVVTALEPDHHNYKTLVSSLSNENPFPADLTFSMRAGTFCETVIKTRRPLLVVDALNDDQWKAAPETRVGMISYLGLPVLYPDGRVFGTICVLDDKANSYTDLYLELLSHFRDVLQDDLKTLIRLGNEIEEQKAQLRELFNRVPEAVVMVDRTLRVRRTNPAFSRIFGYTRSESLGQVLPDLITSGTSANDFSGIVDGMFQGKDVTIGESNCRNKAGKLIPVSVMCVPIPSSSGDEMGYVIYRDISEEKLRQDEQKRFLEMQLELAHATRIATVGYLSASIAHEINQPLTGIVTNCNTCLRLLSTEPADLDGAKEALGRIVRDGHRASGVVTRLRALFSKRESAFEDVDLNEIAREVITPLRDEIQKRQINLRVDFEEGLPLITADRIQLQQVILNLIRNALDAMIAVQDHRKDLHIKTVLEDRSTVRFSIRDTGVGFCTRDTEKMFEAFYSTKENGMGVGLSISRSIVANHRGRLTAVLNDGPGATFSFQVPCALRS